MLDVYTTNVNSVAASSGQVLDRSTAVWRATEESGLRGTLIFTDNYSLDPWVIAQQMIMSTERLVPLVAAQPPYVQPYSVARIVSTLAHLYGRSVDLNFVTGSSRTHLRVVGNQLDHDSRYGRLVEFATIIRSLLTEPEPVVFDGAHYSVGAALLQPPLPSHLSPAMFVAGSSDACVAAATALQVPRLTYPRDAGEYENDPAMAAKLAGNGLRIGILARDSSERAWAEANRRYPRDALRTSMTAARVRNDESSWMRSLLTDPQPTRRPDSPYWLQPFRTSREFCPFLIGSHVEVGDYLARYLRFGVRTLIMNVPREPDDVPNAMVAIDHAIRYGGPSSPGPACHAIA